MDIGICAIHMDDKPLHFRPPTDRNDSDQQNSDASESRPRKRARRVVDSSTTCAPEQLHCRYANKKCLNPRAVKRTGGLHTFCAMHRANANRNQRRLDMRKRMARQALRAQSEAAPVPIVATATTEAFDPRLEPLDRPTPLQEEDISTLVALFLPVTTPQHIGSTPTTPNDWSSSTSTDGTSPPPHPRGGGGTRF